VSDRKLRRKIDRLERENACLQAVNQALWQAHEQAVRAGNAAAYDAGVAEGTQEALAVELEHRDLLGDES
jgi:hypothetical protein